MLTSGIVARGFRRRSETQYIIIMYHRVLNKRDDVSGIQPGMYVLAESLIAQIEFLQRHFNILPLSYLNGFASGKKIIGKPCCFITFDDGWLDFYEVAYPILTKAGAHATVFFPTGFIGTRNLFWTDRLLHIFKTINQNTEINLSDAQHKNKYVTNIVSFQGNYEEKTEKAISFLKQMREDEIDDILSELTMTLNMDVMSNERAFINWDEAREMKASGLIEFGSHTVNHKILNTLQIDEIKYEIKESKETLERERINDGRFFPFCYPSGVYDSDIEKMVKAAGYDLAVSTQKGWNSLKAHPFTLRRMGVHQDMTSTPAMFACKIAGIF